MILVLRCKLIYSSFYPSDRQPLQCMLDGSDPAVKSDILAAAKVGGLSTFVDDWVESQASVACPCARERQACKQIYRIVNTGKCSLQQGKQNDVLVQIWERQLTVCQTMQGTFSCAKAASARNSLTAMGMLHRLTAKVRKKRTRRLRTAWAPRPRPTVVRQTT